MKTFDPKRTNLKRQDHFSIRKFKYGVASVLIETGLLFSPGVVAKASETTATSNPETPVLTVDDNDTTTASSSQEIIAEATETAASSSTPAAEVADTTASTSNEETATDTTADKRLDAEVSASGVVTFTDGTAVQTVTLNGGATTYPVDGGTFVITGTTVSFISNGTTDATYTVTVEAYDADGNKDTETYSVTAKKSESSETTALEAEEVATEETATETATETTTLENVSVSNVLKAEEVTTVQATIEQDATEQTMVALDATNVIMALDDSNALEVAATSATATTSSATTSGTTDNDYRTDKAIITETVEEIAAVTATNPTLNNDHYTKYADYNLNDLKQQIAWLNLNDASVTITDANGNSIEPGTVNTLSVGMTFTQELVPGYTVVVTVTGLQPFQASDVFRQRLIDAGLDPDDPEVRARTGYDPDDYNRYAVLMKDSDDKNYSVEAPVILSTPDSYSSARTYGYDTGDLDGDGNRTDWTAIGVGSPTGSVVGGDGGAVGIQLNIKAYNAAGEQVPANIIMMDNEEAGTNEFTAYTTDGEGWELIYELSNENVVGSYTPLGTRLGLSEYGATMGVDYSLRYFKDKDGHYLSEKSDPLTTSQGGPEVQGVTAENAKYWVSRELTDSTVRAHQFVIAQDGNEEEDLSLIVTDGLGTQVFGPVSNKQNTYSVPIVMSRNAENIGLYIMSTGMQRASIGFIVLDTGDAPDSYGSASHAITNANELPYLGTIKPDADNYTSTTLEDETKVGSGWVLDDNINPVEDGKAAFADEGNLQLVGESEIHNGTELTLHKATDGTYQISVLATAGDTSGVAYVHGFIDFNNNGVFDEGEGSDIVETTNSEPGLVTLTWSDISQSVDTSATQLGFRVRISSNAADIAEATGMAFTGEVEDSTIQQTFPPRGSKVTTSGNKGETQTSQVTFTAYGQIDYDFTTVNTIDTSKVYKLVVDGNEVDDTTLTVAGQGTYTLNNTTGEVTFTPEADFVGTATGIVVRAWDKNGASTGWTADTATNGLENVQQIQTTYTMDSVYIPTVVAPTISGKDVTSTGLQNVTQTGTPTFTDSNGNAVAASATYPAKLVDSDGKLTDSISIAGEGTYTIDPSTGVVTFTPVETFTGVATGVTVQLETSVGTDEDGNAVTATATATYTPTVLATTPTIEDVNTAATTVTVGVPTESIGMVTSLEVTFPVSTNTDTSSTTSSTVSVTLTKGTDGTWTDADGNTYTATTGTDGLTTFTVKVPATADLQATGDGYTTSPITVEASYTDGANTTKASAKDVITNQAPVITTVTAVKEIEKGSSLTEADLAALFDGGSDKEDDTSATDSKTSTVTYVITDASGSVVTPEQAAANPGNYTVTATITDSDGKTDTAVSVLVTKDTTAPTVDVADVRTDATDVTLTVSDDVTELTVNFPVSSNTDTSSSTASTVAVTLTKNADGSYTGSNGNTYTTTANGDGTVSLTVKVPATADLQATGNGYTTSPITVTARDAAGNTATSTDIITNEAPVITATVESTTLAQGDSVDVAAKFTSSDLEDDASATDNKTSTVTYSLTVGDTVLTDEAAINAYISANPGTYTVVATITDSDGKTATASTVFTTEDKSAPVVTVEDVNTAATEVAVKVSSDSTKVDVNFPISTNTDTSSTTTGTTTVTLTKNADGSYTGTDGNTYTPVDNGDGTVTLTVKVPAEADLQATGDGYTTSPITSTATDAAGNSTTSSDVISNEPPVITTVTPTTVIEKGSTPLTEAQIAALFDGGSDKEDDASTTDSKTSTVTYVMTDSEGNVVTPEQVAANPGDYTVTATITDSDGKSATATALITTKDTTSPSVAIENVSTAATEVAVTVSDDAEKVDVTFPVSTNTGTTSTTTGTTTVTLTKNTDGSYTGTDGNTYTPVANGDGTVTLTVKVPADADLQATGDGYTTSPITATATDAAGNSTTSSDVITNTPPVIETTVPVTTITKGASVDVTSLFDGGSDKEDDASTTDAKTSTVTYTAVDASGNAVTASSVEELNS